MTGYEGGDDVLSSSCISRLWQHSSLVAEPNNPLGISQSTTSDLNQALQLGDKFLNGAVQCKS